MNSTHQTKGFRGLSALDLPLLELARLITLTIALMLGSVACDSTTTVQLMPVTVGPTPPPGIASPAPTPTPTATPAPTAPAAASALILSGNGVAVAGTCLTFSVSAADPYGNPAPLPVGSSFALSALGHGQLFGNASCQGSGTRSLAWPAASATFGFSFLDTVAENLGAVSASVAGLTSNALAITLSPGPAKGLGFPTSSPFFAGPLVADTSLPSVNVQIEDAYGNAVASSGISVSLALGSMPNFALLSTGVVPVATTNASGLATFAGLSVDPAGLGFTLVASASGLASGVSPTFNVSGPGAGVSIPAGCPTSNPNGGAIRTVLPPAQGGNLVATLAQSAAGDILCISGEHRIPVESGGASPSPVQPKSNQLWMGMDSNTRISGAIALSSWQQYSPAGANPPVYVYSGSTAAPYPQAATIQNNVFGTSNAPVYYAVSTYADDVFIRDTAVGQNSDQRMMRVLSLSDLTAPVPADTPGQMATVEESGRFFFDYTQTPPVLYIAPPVGVNPTLPQIVVDLAVMPVVFEGTSTPAISNFQMQNLIVEKATDVAFQGGTNASVGWTLQSSTIRFAHTVGLTGASAQSTSTQPYLFNSILFTANGQYGFSGTAWGSIVNSEVSWNNLANYQSTPGSSGNVNYWGAGAFKLANQNNKGSGPPAQNVNTITSIDSHHNVGPGLWLDVNEIGVVINGASHFHHNEWAGVDIEISCYNTLTGAQIDHNGLVIKNPNATGIGIQINSSSFITIGGPGAGEGNLVYANESGKGIEVNLDYQANHSGETVACLGNGTSSGSGASATGPQTNNKVTGNTIYSCDTSAIGLHGTSAYTLAGLNDSFSGNSYYLTDTGSSSASEWFSNGSAKDIWSVWSSSVDTTGTVSTGSCAGPVL